MALKASCGIYFFCDYKAYKNGTRTGTNADNIAPLIKDTITISGFV